MFMLRNASKYLFGNPSSNETIVEIPQGQLYLVRPLSPKGYSELIFPDANCSIRRTGQQYQYQLVVQRVYEEGEEELEAEEEDPESSTAGLEAAKDERTFLLDESLRFRSDSRDGGEIVFAWRDLSGDPGDLYQFVCDSSVQSTAAASFELVAAQCQYERKYNKNRETATDEELAQFSFDDQLIPSASTSTDSPVVKTKASSPLAKHPTYQAESVETAESNMAPPKTSTAIIPASAKQPAPSKEILTNEDAELHLFDFEQEAFVLQHDNVQAVVSDIDKWQYWLQVSHGGKEMLGLPVQPELNPVFNFEHLSFIFNHYSEDGDAVSWLLRFKHTDAEDRFQQGLMQALWEHLNEIKWSKAKDMEREYALDAFQDLTMEDAPPLEEEEEEEEEDDEEDEVKEAGRKGEYYDSDESQDDEDGDKLRKSDPENVNSQLAVGFKNDRTFVVRGSNIGVFKHNERGNDLNFQTNINKVRTPNGQVFSPKKVMLHGQDKDMILQNEKDPNSLYRMDLEYGKVIDEYKVHDDIAVEQFAPEKKYSQMTSEPTFLGLSHNAMYRIDPRLSGNKLVDNEMKQYANRSKAGFSAAATTAAGHIAVASNKGDVRMFDRLGIMAKTHIPALGDPIKGLDVSADGHWILATTRTYLLLIDAVQRSGKNEGKLGFEKSFAKDSKPQPRRLGLTPAHVAQLTHETKTGIDFTSAHFNTGVDSSETTIVTATGPFVVAWSMKKVLKGQKDPYSIKRYSETVKADDFRYGTDRNLVVALPNEVGMEKKSALKRPTRESIAGAPAGPGARMSTPRRSAGGRASALRRNEVVDSPY